MLSKSFYWRIAFISAGAASVVYPISNWFRQGANAHFFAREWVFGLGFTLLMWWYNLRGFTWLQHRFIAHQSEQGLRWIRIITTLLLSYVIIFTDEKLQILHLDRDLTDYAHPDYANEFRAAITAIMVLLVFFLLQIRERFYAARAENDGLKLENSIAQFEMLKQQINPHFLFNSLNILKTMVKNQDSNSEEYVLRLAEFYRALLLVNQRQKISVAEELLALDNYVFMLKARFEDKLQIDCRIAAHTRSTFVPPLALQMLVENCIKHNVVSTDKPLRIQIYSEKSQIVVANNLQTKRSVEDSNRIGLENINRRYRALTGQDIEIERTDTQFIVRLPEVG